MSKLNLLGRGAGSRRARYRLPGHRRLLLLVLNLEILNHQVVLVDLGLGLGHRLILQVALSLMLLRSCTFAIL